MDMIRVKIEKLTPDAKLPRKAKKNDACFDLYCTSKKIKEGKYIQYGTGLAMEIPTGYCGLVFPRSSVTKEDLMLKNSVGVIDSDYRGEVMLRFIETEYIEEADMYEVGERVGQIMFMPVIPTIFKEVDSLTETERGEGGFGSTGK